MFHTSFIELNKKAVYSNINLLKAHFGDHSKISIVVKGNAYGHGMKEYVPIIESTGIDHFSVFSADEAYDCLKASEKNSTIMIMGMIEDDALEWAVEHDIHFYVFDIERLEHAIAAAKKVGKPALLHIEVETGMNRTGFPEHELPEVIDILNANKEHFRFEGLCTHYAGAESIANHVRILEQIHNYNKTYEWFLKQGYRPARKHTACSAAAVGYPETRMDLMRLGIMSYGFWPSQETFIHFINKNGLKYDPLERVISWKSKLTNIKEVKMGEFVGYGTTYLASTDMRIGIVPVGYAHGFSRSLSNQGRVLIKGNRVSVIGMVNMNIMTVDLTNLPEAERGDEVVMIGTQGNLTISVASFGALSEQLNYELLTRLPQNIPRVVK